MISIGAVYNGPELKGSEINKSIMNLSKVIKQFRGPLELINTPVVNVVFIIPGSFGNIEIDEPQYGRYSKAKEIIVVQMPISNEIVNRENHYEFLLQCLYKANDMAFAFLRERGLEFPLAEANTIVDEVGERLVGVPYRSKLQ